MFYEIKNVFYMKKVYLFLILFMFTSFVASAKELRIDGTGTRKVTGITFSDGSSFRLFTSKGHWRASSGDYGMSDCHGTLKNNANEDVEFEVFCKMIDQDEENFIMKFYRAKGSQSSGIGKAIIVDGSKKYAYLINIECNHAITYIKDDYFGIQKCKI